MEICPDKYNKYLEEVKQNGLALEYVPVEYMTEELVKIAVNKDAFALEFIPEKYITEELCKIAVHQHGFTLQYVPLEYITEELIFMAKQTRLWYDDIPTLLTECIFEIYSIMGE